jgi:Ca-activated chloride channel homolog
VGAELATPLGLLGLLAVPAAVLVWRRFPPPLSPRGSRASLALRCAVLAGIALALSGFALQLPASTQALIVVVDRSASIETALAGEAATVQQLRAGLHADDRFGIITFGGDAVVEQPAVVAADSAFGGFATQPNTNATDIEGALRLAASLLPSDARKHIVILSDGRQNTGDALTEVALLRQAGIRVDVLPVDVPAGPEVLVASLRAPTSVPPGSAFVVRAIISSNVATSAGMTVSDDGTVVFTRQLALTSGDTEVDADLAPAPPGMHDIRVSITPALDTFEQNNSADTLVQVLGPQRVLIVEGSPGEGANVAAALHAAGIQASVVNPASVPSTPTGVGAYQAVALVDVSAQQLNTQQMEALRSATENLGVGLSVFGGTDTLGPGGFSGTPLETVLPVDMQVRNPQQKPPVAVVLVLESVESSAGDAVVRGAAKALVEKLSARDYVGVTDSITGLAVPLQQVGTRTKVENAILNIPNFGDPQSYDPYIADAEHALLAHPGTVRHVIVLGDGDTFQPVSASLIAGLVANGITVSTVGVDIDGNPQYMAMMRTVAREGNGRFYQSESPDQVPDILLQEAQTALKPWIVEQPFIAQLGTPGPALAGVDTASIPVLGGYVATTPKAAAEVALYAADHDPLLATWQYGLGEASVWTSDTTGRWTASLLASPEGARLLTNVVAATLPLQQDPRLQLTATSQGTSAQLDLAASSLPQGATVQADVVAPGGAATTVDLVATGPGRYTGDVSAPDVGPYGVRLIATDGGHVVAAISGGFTVSYSPEYRYLGTDRGFVAQLAARGGGTMLADAAAAAAVTLPPSSVVVPLAAGLLGAALVLLIADIALRRLAFRSGDAGLWAQALRPARDAAPAPVEETVGRLRRRVGAVRGERPSDDQPAKESQEDLAARLLERRRRRG